MALADRRGHRRRSRWLIVALLLSVGALAIQAIASAGSDGPAPRIARLAYLDRVREQIERSTAQGMEVANLRAEPAQLVRGGLARRTQRVATQANAVLREVSRTDAPEPLAVAHSLLVATMAVRARAVISIGASLVEALAAGPVDAALDALAQSGQDLAAADRTYQVFVASLPPGVGQKPSLPASQWLSDARLWDRAELAAFVGTMRASATPVPVHNLAVLAVSTQPAAVAVEGGASVLPLIKTLRLEIVVANAGNTTERSVPVVATLQGPGGEVDTARDTVDLSPGQRRSLNLAGLRPVQTGGISVLTVVVGPVEGETDTGDNQRLLPITLRG